MIVDRLERDPGTRFLFTSALVVIVVGGLKMADSILLPFALALFLAVLTLPIVVFLQKRGIPTFLAILIAVLVDLAIFGLLILLASQSISDFQGNRDSDAYTGGDLDRYSGADGYIGRDS